MGYILAFSFKIVFALLSFGVTPFPFGIGVSISHSIFGNVSPNWLSIGSCCTHCFQFSVSDSQGTSLLVDPKKESFPFWAFLSTILFCLINSFIALSVRSMFHGSVFFKKISNCGNVWLLFSPLISLWLTTVSPLNRKQQIFHYCLHPVYHHLE